MKCEKCPYHIVEGLNNALDWCKLYNAGAPVEGCESERDTIIKQQEMMQEFYKKVQQNE